ncbi:hypothetical protein BH24CHL1_BH24CHL1_16410 [soil metagenome]
MDQQQHRSQTQPEKRPETDDAFVKEDTADIPTVKAATATVAAFDGRRPAPFVPDFAWRPGFNDFPVALIASSAAVKRRAQGDSTGWQHWPTLETVGENRSPARYIPHVLAVAAVIAIVMSNGFWLNRSDSPSDDAGQPGVAVVEDAERDDTPSTGSLLDRDLQPGQGGNVPAPTQTVQASETEDTLSAPGDEATQTPEAGSSATADRPMIPNPAVPSGTSTVAVPEAGVITYETTRGQTLLDIADQFGVSAATMMWVNSISDPRDEMPSGTEVIVPAVDGVLHTVVASDTVAKIAARYGATSETIVNYPPNGIVGSPNLRVGQMVMIPGAVISDWGKIQTYTVRPGDSLWEIASYYGLEPETLVWANALPRPELISPGQKLIVPPGNGALIEVQSGDHVEAIAARFGVDAAAIRSYGFNNLADGRVLQVGQQLLVPGVGLPDLAAPSELNADTVAGEDAFNPATGTFLWPTNGFISQEFGGSHNGLDIANEEWTPVNATDGGIVIFAGWNDYGLGYAVGVDHGNGYQTWYGHLANEPYVEVGQVVWQGGYLGPMGNTGKSTGPHLHFIIMKDGVYQNPQHYLD